jgi:hypothetical protein
MHHPSIPPSPLVAKTTDFGRAVAALATGGAVEVDAETVVVDIQCGSLDAESLISFSFWILDFVVVGWWADPANREGMPYELRIEIVHHLKLYNPETTS